jgi:thermostable 8-oxoguanine DNA glycosylase
MDDKRVEKYLDHYTETQGLLPEKLEEYRHKLEENGYLTREELYELAYESSTRSAYHVKKNSEERCREVTSNLFKLEGSDFSQIAVITALKGFKAPTASVILAVKNPDRHAVVDTRVWASLERLGYLEGRKESFDANDYVEMIQSIREISAETGFSPEEIGYALFAMDVDKREGTLH